jgi:hypothetical protein
MNCQAVHFNHFFIPLSNVSFSIKLAAVQASGEACA